jgi:hypothetical protein
MSLRADTSKMLGNLAAKGEGAQWEADELIDGGRPTSPRFFPSALYAALISQFYHGERATLRLCRRLLERIGDSNARRCLAVQIIDEERHARVYRAYLERLGDIAEPEPTVADVYRQALAWTGPPEAMVAAFNIVLEGEALRTLDDFGGWLPCPWFKRINARVSRDEARHFAFGQIYLRAALPRLGRDQRLEIHGWLKTLWDAVGNAALAGFYVPRLITRRRRRRWVEAGWRSHRAQLISIGLVDADEALLAERFGVGHR